MKTAKVRWFYWGVPIALIALGAAYYGFTANSYEVFAVKRGDIQEAVYGLGTVKSNKVYELKSGVTVTVMKLFVKEGDAVSRGQTLVKFDEGGASAPFPGVVTLLPFHEKENVFPQTPILRIEDLRDLYVELSLEQQGALRVRQGQNAKMSFESIRGSLIEGKVESVFPKADQFVVRIQSGELPEGVLPGMTADVAIQVGERKNVLLIPFAAVSNGRITVNQNGRKQKLNVKIGAVDGDWAEVKDSDLQEGAQVIVPKKVDSAR